jgi:hypothetical protein
MNEETKLILALHQIENLTSLLSQNEYQQYIYHHLIQMQVELQRQLTNLTHSSKMSKSNTN